MKKFAQHIFLNTLFLLVFTASAASAGGRTQAEAEIYFKSEEVIKFAKKVEKTMADKGARVAIIARVGRPRNQLPEGIGFTHTALAVYSQLSTADGRSVSSYSIYNLYQRAETPNISDLIQDSPEDFFSRVEVLEAGIIIPSPELQKRLLDVIVSPTYKELHNSNYSLISNPFTLDFQNCTEHILDIITAAIYQTNDLKTIKANEKAYFEAQPVKVNPIKLAIASMFSADITTSDHPGSPETATFETIGKFLTKFKAASEVLIVTPDV